MKSFYFVGIKGVGMAPLAVMAKEAGKHVSGSDVAETYITDPILEKAGISIQRGFHASHIQQPDIVITTGAHNGLHNEEVLRAKKKGIQVLTQGEAVGYFMSGDPFDRKDMQGISVAGCHGKTTTSALIATILIVAGKDPSFVIGTGFIPSLGSSGHYGKGAYFVAEADEYATEPQSDKTPKFLWQHPRIAVVTNIEYDHPDLYPTFASLVQAYTTFIRQVVGEGGHIVACGDDVQVRKILQDFDARCSTYGYGKENTYQIEHGEPVVEGMEFSMRYKGKTIGTYVVPLLGEHSILNAAAGVIVGILAGLSAEDIKKGLLFFQGTKRRMEFVGTMPSGASIFDDYAHHPTEIRKTLGALRDRYKETNIICVFQPHTYSRTKLLFDEFCDSFKDANLLILCDIYASQREQMDATISSKQLAEKISHSQAVLYLPKLSDVVQYFNEKQPDAHTIIVTMGAGDVYKIAYEMNKK